MKHTDLDRCYRDHLLRANLLDLGHRTEQLVARLEARSMDPDDAYERLASLFGSLSRAVAGLEARVR